MSILANLRHFAEQRRLAYREAVTRRALEDLPHEIQKDIGYPRSSRGRQSVARNHW